MYNKTFPFKKQLTIGNKGEKSFIKYYKELNPRKSGCREIDILINDGEKVELKSDSYSEEKTKNFFIELIGNNKTKKKGGPFLSVQNDIDFFVYHFQQNKTFYWFLPRELVKFIDNNGHKYEKREIWNMGWSSVGLLVPRSEVEHLVIRKDIFK